MLGHLVAATTAWTLWIFLVLPGAAGPMAEADTLTMPADPCPPAGLPRASLILDGVPLELCTPFPAAPSLIVAEPDNAIQVATAWTPGDFFQELTVTAVPFGTRPATEALPVAHPQGAGTYRAALQEFRRQQGGNPQPGPAATLFDTQVPGLASVVDLPVDGQQSRPVLIVEWVAEAGNRQWIVRASRALPGEPVARSQLSSLLVTLTGVSLSSPDVDQPSSSLAAVQATRHGPAGEPWVGQSATETLPYPDWWTGECDAEHYRAVSGTDAFPLGAAYRGLQACGPRPLGNPALDVLVRFADGLWGAYEWECVELAMRFLYLAYGVSPYPANGSQVVWNYPGSRFEKVANGTPGRAPRPNDILSYGSTSTFGHTALVVESHVNAAGYGTIQVIEQNNAANGSNSLPVSDWWVAGNAGSVSGWLHDPQGEPTRQVRLFDQAGLQGNVVFAGGVGFSNEPNGNAGSLEIPAGWAARTWRQDSRGGEEHCWPGSVSDLHAAGWQDAIQSIEVFDYNACLPNPPAPVLLSPAAGAQFQEGQAITLAWDDNSAAEGSVEFLLEIVDGQGHHWESGWQAETARTVEAQWLDVQQSWRVKARNGGGEGAWSSPRAFGVRPRPPAHLAGQASGCRQAVVHWTDRSALEAGYRIYRDGRPVDQVEANVTAYQDSGVQGAAVYAYTVRAFRGNLESEPGTTVTLTVPVCSPGLASPTGLVVTDRTAGSVKLAWQNRASNASASVIYRWHAWESGGEFVPVDSVGPGLATYEDGSLNCGRTYLYAASAHSAMEESALSAWIAATTAACPAANQPPTLAPIPDQHIEMNTAAQVWLAVHDLETSPAALTFSAASSNPALVTTGQMAFAHRDGIAAGAAASLLITPTRNLAGTAVITVTVQDGQGAATSTAFALAVNPLVRRILYVNGDAGGAGDGSRWADAYPSLPAALAAAGSGAEIWVAAGVYRPDAGSGVAEPRQAAFQLQNGVALYGGFSGTETSRTQRDWQAHVTVLSGDIGLPGDSSDNSHHVVIGQGIGATAVLDGFTIRDGNAQGAYPHDAGGGLLLRDASPTLANLVFTGNAATYGGGLSNLEGGSPVLSEVRFAQNKAIHNGGGLHNIDGGNPRLAGVTFVENSAGWGGGLFNSDDSHPMLAGVVFDGNTATRYGGGVYNGSHSSPTFRRVTFSGNQADWGGGLYNTLVSSPVLLDTIFSDNTATYGGGISNTGESHPTLVNVTFRQNVAGQNGGGLHNLGDNRPQIANAVFDRNQAGWGAGLFNGDGGQISIAHGTLAGNTALHGGGALFNAGGDVVLGNTVAWGNQAGAGAVQIQDQNGETTVSYSLIQGGYPGTGNLEGDPLFVDAAGGDLRLQSGSPAQDSGHIGQLPADVLDLDGNGNLAEPLPVDLAGLPRLAGGGPDMGAYELPAPAHVVSGRVINGQGDPLAGVVVATSAGISARTDATGTYALAPLAQGTHILTPTRYGHHFQPVTHTVAVQSDQTGRDFTGRRPVLMPLPDQVVQRNSALGPLALTLAGSEGLGDRLRLQGFSSNPLLVPDSAIAIDGDGGQWSLNIMPVAGRSGKVIITLVVSTPEIAGAVRFGLTVVGAGDIPDPDGDHRLYLPAVAKTRPR